MSIEEKNEALESQESPTEDLPEADKVESSDCDSDDAKEE